jgi:hypothetical protein
MNIGLIADERMARIGPQGRGKEMVEGVLEEPLNGPGTQTKTYLVFLSNEGTPLPALGSSLLHSTWDSWQNMRVYPADYGPVKSHWPVSLSKVVQEKGSKSEESRRHGPNGPIGPFLKTGGPGRDEYFFSADLKPQEPGFYV